MSPSDDESSSPSASDSQSVGAHVEYGEWESSWSSVSNDDNPDFVEHVDCDFPLYGAFVKELGAEIVGRCVGSDGKVYYEAENNEGNTAAVTEEQIYEWYPKRRPMVVTIKLFLQDEAVMASAWKPSGEQVHAFRLFWRNSHRAMIELRQKLAEALHHDEYGIVVLNAEGELLHNRELFDRMFRDITKPLREAYKAKPEDPPKIHKKRKSCSDTEPANERKLKKRKRKD